MGYMSCDSGDGWDMDVSGIFCMELQLEEVVETAFSWLEEVVATCRTPLHFFHGVSVVPTPRRKSRGSKIPNVRLRDFMFKTSDAADCARLGVIPALLPGSHILQVPINKKQSKKSSKM